MKPLLQEEFERVADPMLRGMFQQPQISAKFTKRGKVHSQTRSPFIAMIAPTASERRHKLMGSDQVSMMLPQGLAGIHQSI